MQRAGKRKYISLFSGAMGLDLGLEMAGFKAAVAIENDEEAVQTIRANRPNLRILGDITKLSGENILSIAGMRRGVVSLVAGGPPCQAFSVFGQRNGIRDPRGRLLFDFVRIIDETRPDVFIMENVRGLLSMPLVPKQQLVEFRILNPEDSEHGSLLRTTFEDFVNFGYRVDCFVVNAVNYGAPQIRERIICIGNRHGLLAEFPQPQYSNRPSDHLPPFRVLGDVVGPKSGFIDPCPEVMNFSDRKRKYLALVPPGGNWRSMPVELQKESMGKSWYLKGGRSAYWRKLSFAFPSPTVVTMPNHAGTSMCHPSELRAITVGEAAAIQEFPKEWVFVGTTTAKMRQVGNAVPTRLGRIAGEVVNTLLRRIEMGDNQRSCTSAWRIVHLRPHVRTRTFWKDGKAYAGDHSYYKKATPSLQKSLFR